MDTVPEKLNNAAGITAWPLPSHECERETVAMGQEGFFFFKLNYWKGVTGRVGLFAPGIYF